ncbi:hypothetical protein AB7M63_006170 [Bradyrhizobium japonicum]
MFLQIAAEHNGLTFPKQRSPDFLEYWVLFEQQANLQVTSKPSMSRLNRARANLKHGGVLPAHDEIEGFRATVTSFLEDNAPLLMGIDLDGASLTSIIRSDDVREPLEKAEVAFSANELENALGELAIAFAASLRRFERRPRSTSGPLARPYSLRDVTSTLFGGYGPQETREVERTLYRMSDAFSEAITVVAYNLDFDSYLLFKTHAPVVHEFIGGRMQVEWMFTRPAPMDPLVVRRCLNFVIDTAVRLEALT